MDDDVTFEALDDDNATGAGGGGEVFDKSDVEDADELRGMIEWKADPLLTVVVGPPEEIVGPVVLPGAVGDDAGEPVDPTLGGGGGNEYGENLWD